MKFEFWIDSIDHEVIKYARDISLLYGVTTNPSILASTSQDPMVTIRGLLDLSDFPLAVQVTALNCTEMVKQARKLSSISDRIIVKIPCTIEGYKALTELKTQNVRCLATAIYTFRQFMIASKIGVEYAAPYFSRIIASKKSNDQQNSEEYTFELIKEMLSIKSETKLMLAAISSPGQIDSLINIGVSCMTIPKEQFEGWVAEDDKTSRDTKSFISSWEKANFSSHWLD